MKARDIRLMNLTKRVAKLKQLPPKVCCEEISQGAIDELIDIQLNAKKRKQVVEFYYNLVQQEHVADPRTDEELKEYYRALALDKQLDPAIRVNSLKYFLALKHHLFQQRADINLDCSKCKHNYKYVGGTTVVLKFVCEKCGAEISSFSPSYASESVRKKAIADITKDYDTPCSHDWKYVGGRINTINFVCRKCGEHLTIESEYLADRAYRIKEISNYDERVYLSAYSSSNTKTCYHSWIKTKEYDDNKKVMECTKCKAVKTQTDKCYCEHDWRYNHKDIDLLVCKNCGVEKVISERDINK